MANTICSIITHLHTQTRAIDHSGGAGGIYVLKIETPILDDHGTNGVLRAFWGVWSFCLAVSVLAPEENIGLNSVVLHTSAYRYVLASSVAARQRNFPLCMQLNPHFYCT
jgi:hypothetical protein